MLYKPENTVQHYRMCDGRIHVQGGGVVLPPLFHSFSPRLLARLVVDSVYSLSLIRTRRLDFSYELASDAHISFIAG